MHKPIPFGRNWLASLFALCAAGALFAQSDITQPGDPIVASSNNTPGSEGVANVIDNGPAKYLNFDGAHQHPTGFTVTPSVGSSIVTGITIQSANDSPERDPATYTLEGSNDGTNFTTISFGDVPAFSDRFVTVRVDFTNNFAYKAYRVTFPTTAMDNGCCMQVAEVELLGNVAPQDVTQPGDPIVASSNNTPGSEGVANVIDNGPAKYLNFDGAHQHPTGFTVTPSVGKTIVTGITLQSANDSPERDPATYTLEGSNDGGTTYTLISSNAVPAFSDRFVTVEVDFDNTSAYTSYRVTFPTTAMDNGCCMQVAEVELLGFATGSSALPQFKTQPVDAPTLAGYGARFYVKVNGPWQVQWYKGDGTLIPGANKLVYTTDAITAANDGDAYYATAKNGALVSQSDVVHVRLFTPSVTKSIGINFIGQGANGAPTAIGTNEVAGVQPQAYWNNTPTDASNGDFPATDVDGNPVPFTDSNNADAAPITVNFVASNRWGSGTGTDNANAKLLNGFLDSGDITITISGVPAGKHSVIVYGVNRPLAFSDADYGLTDGNGTAVPSIYIRDQNADEYNAAPGFIRGTSTDSAQRTVANYVRFDNVASPDGGTITITAKSAASAPVSSFQLLINPPAVGTPAQITSQPASKNVVAGAGAAFTVVATGTAPLTYEWRKGGTKLNDGGNISGAKTATLTLSNVQAADAGNYTVAVANNDGSVNSSAAVLSVYNGAINDRLVAYFTFDETTGLKAKNGATGGSDGDLKGYDSGATWGAGKIGGALTFDGSSQFVLIPNYAKASSAVAVSAWVNSANNNDSAMVIANSGAKTQQGIHISQFELGLSGTDGDARGYIAAGPNPLTAREGLAAPLSVGEWHHLVMTADGGRLTLYRDGQRVNSTDYSGQIAVATADCIGIGGILDNTVDPTVDPVNVACDHVDATTPGLWTGQIDDVAVWTRTLGADEIAAIYAAGLAGKAVTTIPTVTPPATGPTVNPNPSIPGLSGGAFTDVQVDTANKTISALLPAGGAAGFIKITSDPAITIKTVQIVGGRIVVTY
ncbi:MAG TPA: LamG-like jellyroll fold domain-containing protein [Candidatus Limnocylindria bacterium]|nr:LamG-like jellyroll fold domain-containing protein [Candidatus Limnocylindria bacterium]